jgi:energy-coupling factor transporter ATP-binding protein EcfA2
MPENLLEVSGLTYSQPNGPKALDDVSFSVQPNETLILLGPNGSGKTTLLLHLNGTLSGSGRIFLEGREISEKNLPEIRRNVGIVFQDADEQLFMPTVLEDVMFGPLNLGLNSDEASTAAQKALADVGIGKDLFRRPPFQLSQGEKRRVALAGVLAMKPKLLLLDEPTTSLDPPGQKSLVRLLKTLPQSKVIATHDIHFAAQLGGRAIFLDRGRLLADGSLSEIVRRFKWNPYD